MFLTLVMLMIARLFLSSIGEPHTWLAKPVLVYYEEEVYFTNPEYNWRAIPILVIYNTGQVFQFVRDGYNQRDVREGQLSHRELCGFLYQVEQNGFWEVGPEGFSYPSEVTVLDGGYTLIWVRAWEQEKIYAHVLDFVISEGYAALGVADFYDQIRNFELKEYKPYTPQQIEMRIELYEQPTSGLVWPFPERPLADLYREGSLETPIRRNLLLDGEWAERIYRFFKNRISLIFFDSNAFFEVTIRPILPYEDTEAEQINREFAVSADAPQFKLTCP